MQIALDLNQTNKVAQNKIGALGQGQSILPPW